MSANAKATRMASRAPKPGHLTFLLAILLDPSRYSIQSLAVELNKNRQSFVDLLHTPPRSSEERKTIESGQLPVDGSVQQLDEGIKQEILFLAQELDASEFYCGSLLSYVWNDETSQQVPRAEAAIAAYHTERRDALQCLKLIFEGALNQEYGDVAESLEKYAMSIMQSSPPSGPVQGSEGFVMKLLKEIDGASTAIRALQAAVAPGPAAANPWQQAPAMRPAARLDDAVLRERIKCYESDRRQLGHILFYATSTTIPQGEEIIALLRWLQNAQSADELSVYVFCAYCAALNSNASAVIPSSPSGRSTPLLESTSQLKSINEAITKTAWEVQELKALVQLQWTLFISQGVQRVHAFLSDRLQMTGSQAEELVYQAIQGNAFQYLTTQILSSRPAATLDDDSLGMELVVISESIQMKALEPDFRLFALRQIELLVLGFLRTMTPILRKMRQREEDTGWARTAPERTLSGTYSVGGGRQRRNDFEALLLLIAVIYADSQPDAGLSFWENRDDPSDQLPVALRHFANGNTLELRRAALEMLASLAKGPKCSLCAHQFLTASETQCSWPALFNSLEYYAKLSRTNQNVPQDPAPDFQDGDIESMLAALRLVRNVTKTCYPARMALRENYHPLQTLLSISARAIPLNLKAALFETMAVLCGGDDKGDVNAAQDGWVELEKPEVVSKAHPGDGNVQARPGPSALTSGVLQELEEVETQAQTYPSSTSFIHLLNSLIHVPKNAITLRRRAESQAILEGLGSSYRVPGIGPYIKFVVDDVLLKVLSRSFADPAELWRVTEACLCFVEKCLACYDLTSLLSDGSTSRGSKSSSTHILSSLVTQPGFDLFRRISTDEKLVSTLFKLFELAYVALMESGSQTPPLCRRSIRRCLRIIYRVLDVQKLFLEVLLPILGEAESLPGRRMLTVDNPKPLDQFLLYSPPTIEHIALLINSEDEGEIVFLVLKILIKLSDSPFFSALDDRYPDDGRRGQMTRLAGFLQSSSNPHLIISGLARLLEVDSFEESDVEEDIDHVLRDIDDLSQTPSLSQAIRSTILDLLLINTARFRPAPNVAHFFMNFNLSDRPRAENFHSSRGKGSQRSCLHVILDLLTGGRSAGRRSQSQSRSPSFSIRHPILGEKCYRLIYQLCTHDWTSIAMMRYLRTEEDFSVRQLACIPIKPPASRGKGSGRIRIPGSAIVYTTCQAVTAFLRMRSWLLEIAALELHMLMEIGQLARAGRLAEILFSSSDDPDFRDAGQEDIDLLDISTGQSPMRVLDIFYSFDIMWEDDIQSQGVPLKYFSVTDISACLRLDEDGCQVYDSTLLLSSVNAIRQRLQRESYLHSKEQQDDFRADTGALLQQVSFENHRRKIEHAKDVGLASWRRALDIALGRCFEYLPEEQRELILFELLLAVPTQISSLNASPSASNVLSESVLSLATKLREQGHSRRGHSNSLQDYRPVSLEMDRLQEIEDAVLASILRTSASESVRGNLYSVLINLFHKGRTYEGRGLKGTDDLLINEGASARLDVTKRSSRGRHATLLQGTIFGKLLQVACRDASDGKEVWKTIAFTLLDNLVVLSRRHNGAGTMDALNLMVQQGYLRGFIESLKASEDALIMILKPQPFNLNALYVYEANMALLLRIAETHDGAQRLVDAQILATLAQCGYLGIQPEEDQTFMDCDSFLPSAIERYHQLLVPALQLMVFQLLTAHRGAFVTVLRDDGPVSLATLREYQLLVSLITLTLPIIKAEDLTSQSVFGVYHSSILALAAKSMSGSLQGRISPMNETERQEIEELIVPVFGKRTSMFQEKVEKALSQLNEWMLLYLTTVSEEKGHMPVFDAVIATSTMSVNGRVIASMPNLGSAMRTFETLTLSLASSLSLVEDLRQKLLKPENLTVEDVNELLQVAGIGPDEIIEEANRGQMAVGALEMSLAEARRTCSLQLHCSEMLSLLIWRHLQKFLTQTELNPDVLRLRAARELGGCLDKLEDLIRSYKAVGNGSGYKVDYLQSMVRKLRTEVVGDPNLGQVEGPRGMDLDVDDIMMS